MAVDFETSLREAAETIAHYVKDAATLTVETRYVIVDDDGDIDFSQAKPLAQTVIKLDGDSSLVAPMRLRDGRLELDADLLRLHNANVQTAIDYRARILSSLLEMMQSIEL
ncbi:MAG: hypothetical protein GXN93_01200 [Candidatus Diapherotrites archaeon]|nr:hypothetical protein [Candidatus Diapherotrites archaeon]